MPLSWVYLLQMCLLFVFLTALVTLAISWCMFYWNEQIIRAEHEVYAANKPGPLELRTAELENQEDWEAAQTIKSWDTSETQKLVEKGEDGHYKYKVDPESGKIVPNNVV